MRAAILALLAALAGGCGTGELRHLPADGALGPYSGSVATSGLVFVSGKIGATADAALDAVQAELLRWDLTLADVVQATLYLTDMGDYAALNEAWARRVPEPWPARTTVAVAALPAGARLEIAVVARR